MSTASDHLGQTIRHLTSLLKLVKLHDGLENVVFSEQIPALSEHLRGVFETERALHIEGRDALVLANKRIVKGVGQGTADELGQGLSGLGLSGIWIGRPLQEDEVRRFLVIVQREGAKDAPAEAILKALDEHGLIGKLRVVPEGEGGGTADQQTIKIGDAEYFPLAYGRLLVLLREYARQHDDPELARYFRQKLHRASGEIARLLPRYARRLMALSTIRNDRDPLFGHFANSGLLAILLGQRLGFNRRQLADLALAVFMQGVGQWFTVDRELSRAAIVLRGFSQDRELSTKALCTAVVALAPPEAPSTDAHPYVRIIRICTVYDELLAGRGKQEPLRPDEALKKMLEDDAARYDQVMLKAFANLIGVFPTGSVVRLESGEVAVVVYPNPGFPGRPLVAIARNNDGTEGDGHMVDLAEQDVRGDYRAKITISLDPAVVGVRPTDYLL